MILKEYALAWNLYKACSGWRLINKLFYKPKASTYCYLWAALAFYVLIMFSWLFVSENWLWMIGLLSLVSFEVFVFARDKALVKEFAVEFEKHRIADYPPNMRLLYLRYALFLRGLAEQQRSSEEVSKLASFAEIAGKPELASKLVQHPIVILVLGLLSALLIQLMTGSDLWKAGQRLLFLVPVVVTLFVLLMGLGIGRRPKQKHAEIKRFLERAKLDIEEEKANIALKPTPLRGAA